MISVNRSGASLTELIADSITNDLNPTEPKTFYNAVLRLMPMGFRFNNNNNKGKKKSPSNRMMVAGQCRKEEKHDVGTCSNQQTE